MSRIFAADPNIGDPARWQRFLCTPVGGWQLAGRSPLPHAYCILHGVIEKFLWDEIEVGSFPSASYAIGTTAGMARGNALG